MSGGNNQASVERRTSAKDPLCIGFASCSACFRTESWRQKGAASQPLAPGPLGVREREPTPPADPVPEWTQYRGEQPNSKAPHNPPPSVKPTKAAVANLLSRDFHDAIIKYSQRRREPLFKGRSLSPPPPAPRHLQPSKTNVDFYRAKTHSVYESEAKVFKNFVENLPAKVNIDNSDTLSKLKKDFNTVLLEKKAKENAEVTSTLKGLYRKSSGAGQVSIRSRSATPTRGPIVSVPRITIYHDSPRKDLDLHRPADKFSKHHVNVPVQDAQPRALVRSDRSDYDQVLVKLGKSGRHYDQTVPLQVGKVLMAA